MPYLYIQAGRTLNRMSADGRAANPVDLGPGISFGQRDPQFAVINRRVVVGNSPTHNLIIEDGNGVDGVGAEVFPMSPSPPITAPTLTAVAKRRDESPSVTGTYKVRVSFACKNENGQVVSESPLGPESAVLEATDQVIEVNGIPTSNEPGVNTRRVYRTLTGGSVYFWWKDIDNNKSGMIKGAPSDELLSQTPAPDRLGNPPGSFGTSSRLELMVSWKGQLFGRAGGSDEADRDTLLWSEIRQPWAWPARNSIPIPPVGGDAFGITALIPRRDVLGIGKRDSLHIITSPNPAAAQRRQIAEVGVVSDQSVILHEDVAWFLSEDGIYEWGTDNTVKSITYSSVHDWFVNDHTFERSAFDRVRGFWHEGRRSLIFLMPSTGQNSLNRWIEYYVDSGIWLGPHSTKEFTPTGLYSVQDSASVEHATYTSLDGQLYREGVEGYDGPFQPGNSGSVIRFNETVERPVGAPLGNWVEIDFTIPEEGEGQIAIDNGTSVIFPWSLLERIPSSSDEEAPTGNTLALSVSGLPSTLQVSRTSDNKLLLFTKPMSPALDAFPLKVVIFDASDVLTGDDSRAVRDGINIEIETNRITANEPEYFKHWGEISVIGEIGPGNNFSITTDAGGEDLVQVVNREVRGRLRLHRIGDDTGIRVRFRDSSSAFIELYGYEINPVNIIGRR